MRMRLVAVVAVALLTPAARGDVKSSLQPGDKAPGLEAIVATGEFAGQKLDYLAKIKDKPVLLIAVSRVTRPGHRLLVLCDKYGLHRKDDGGLQTVILRLTDDVPKAVEYSKLLEEKYGIRGVALVSSDGSSGPPAWGFNTDAELTILLLDKSHTTAANFALVSPDESDFRAVRAAIDTLLGDAKREFKP
jgi:hypothetical protein